MRLTQKDLDRIARGRAEDELKLKRSGQNNYIVIIGLIGGLALMALVSIPGGVVFFGLCCAVSLLIGYRRLKKVTGRIRTELEQEWGTFIEKEGVP